MKILLVNPPIYDFSAYDFWLKPYSLLKLATAANSAGHSIYFFDYLDKDNPAFIPYFTGKRREDKFGRGTFPEIPIEKPPIYKDIKRIYKRFGWPRKLFIDYLESIGKVELAIIQTSLTYWYPALKETIEDIRKYQPQAKIVLIGLYATICKEHVSTNLDVDLIVKGKDLSSLEELLETKIDPERTLPYWNLYPNLKYGVMKLTEGCPFRCSYCAAALLYSDGFRVLSLEDKLKELNLLYKIGVKDIAFYDDALLYKPEDGFYPFLEKALLYKGIRFHTPNGIHARFIDKKLAEMMVKAGFTSFYLGLESTDYSWQLKSGGKVYFYECREAVEILRSLQQQYRRFNKDIKITTYIICGHPDSTVESIEASMHAAHNIGARIMLAEFSPIPGTIDGQKAANKLGLDLSEPLTHNKTAYAIWFLKEENIQRLKALARHLNTILDI